jgi:hypothetical protein
MTFKSKKNVRQLRFSVEPTPGDIIDYLKKQEAQRARANTAPDAQRRIAEQVGAFVNADTSGVIDPMSKIGARLQALRDVRKRQYGDFEGQSHARKEQ